MKKYNFPINNIPITKENYQIFRKKENFENNLNSKKNSIIKQNKNNNNNKKKKILKKFSQYYQKN